MSCFKELRPEPHPKHLLQITTRTLKEPDFEFDLLPLHSTLLRQSLLFSFPLIDMPKFSELITDGTITNFKPSLLSLVQASLSGDLKQREDCLGLPYPDIRPRRIHGNDSETIYINSGYPYQIRGQL
jgi:hypothetical protein